MRQIDVIGEWLPDPERRSGTRWANGLLWQHIRDYVLVKDTTKTGQEADIDGVRVTRQLSSSMLLLALLLEARW